MISSIDSVQSARAIEFTDCIFAKGYDTNSNEYLRNDIKPSDGEAPVLEIWGRLDTHSLPLIPG